MEIVTILDTSIGENGPTQNPETGFLKISLPIRIHCDLASGDTVLIQGRLSSVDSWDTIHTFTDETPVDVYFSRETRVIRSIDGASGDSKVRAMNPYETQLTLTEHTA